MASAGSDGASPSRLGWPSFWEGEAPAEPRWPLPARTEPRPPDLVGPVFGRAKLLLSRDGLCRLGQSLALPGCLPQFLGGRSSCRAAMASAGSDRASPSRVA